MGGLRQRFAPACKGLWMFPSLAMALMASTAAAQVEVELIVSEIGPDAPAMLTVTASTPPDEPVLAYEWRGLGVAPRCRARDCTIEVPVASCRRIEVAVTDRFGRVATAEQQLCAGEAGARPPRAIIEVVPGDPVRVAAKVERGDAMVTITRMWIDGEEVDVVAEIPKDGQCHVIDLLASDVEGRIGLDQRFVCGDPDAPRILLGAEPSFCPRAGEVLNVCADVVDPLGRGVSELEGAAVPLDGCAELEPSGAVERIVVRGEAGDAVHGSMIACTAPSSGRPVLLFARMLGPLSLVRGEMRTAHLMIDGGEPPFTVRGRLIGTDDLPIDLSGSERSFPIPFSLPVAGNWTELQLEVTDERGLSARVTVPAMTKDPTAPNGGLNNQVSFGCTSAPLDGAALWLLLGALPWLWRRR